MKRPAPLALVLLAVACGKSPPKVTALDAAAAPVAADAAAPAVPTAVMGLPTVVAFQYTYGKGAKAWKPVAAALEAKDWPAVQAACEATLALDPLHLEAHRLLATALVQKDDFAAAAEHLGVALAGDWIRFGPELEADPDLARLFAAPAGAAVKAQNAALRAGYQAAIREDILVLGRRGPYKAPEKTGAVYSVPGAEVYAYDVDSKRYLRVTRTGDAVAAFLRAPSGDELAYLTWNKITTGTPTVLAEARVGVVNVVTPEAPGKEARFKNVRGLGLHYRAGDQLVATPYLADGELHIQRGDDVEIDKAAGKTTPIDPVRPAEEVVVSHESATVVRTDPANVVAVWADDGGSGAGFSLAGGSPVALAGQRARHDSFFWSPGKKRLAFATWADPCATTPAARQSSLFLVDPATGQTKLLVRGEADLQARWLDDDRLVFEDDDQALRLYHAGEARELERLTARGGLALFDLSASRRPVCKGKRSTEFDWAAESFGPLHIGLEEKDAEALLGAPDTRPELEEEAATGDMTKTWTWKSKGVEIFFSGTGYPDEPSARAFSCRAPCAYKSKKGIGLGSTRPEVATAYGEWLLGKDELRDSPDVIVVGEVYGGVQFEMVNNEVASVFVGASAE